jgi:RNA polymerase sigma factor (sigma-70 family)
MGFRSVSRKVGNGMIEQGSAELPSDAELIVRARQGDRDAFGLLYERHVGAARTLARCVSRSASDVDDLVSDAFAKVLSALQRDAGPDVAFRPYLLACVRNSAYDRTRRDKKLSFTDEVPESPSGADLDDPLVADFERGTAAAAFAKLPERWRMVLWHTEVEGMEPAEIAPLLGLSANAVAALAYRARDGLRQAFLQAQLREDTKGECRYANERFGALLRDRLSSSERQRVETHLDDCARCKGAYVDLLDSNHALRSVIAPLVLGAGSVGYLAHYGVGSGPAAHLARISGRVRTVGRHALRSKVFIGAASIVVATAGIGTALVVSRSAGTKPSAITVERPGTASRGSGGTSSGGPVSGGTSPSTPKRGASTTTAPHGTTTTKPRAGTHGSTPTTTLGASAKPAGVGSPVVVPAVHLVVSIGAVGNLSEGGNAFYVVGVRNHGTGVANTVVVDTTVARGVSLSSASGNGWTCTTTADKATCRAAALAPDANGRILLSGHVTGASQSSAALHAAAQTTSLDAPAGDLTASTNDSVFDAGARVTRAVVDGPADITIASNSVVSCDLLADPTCAADRAGTGPNQQNGDTPMTYVNTSAAPGIFDSSTANLALPVNGSNVEFAGLYWSGNRVASGGCSAPINAANRNIVLIKAPLMSGFAAIGSTTVSDVGDDYQTFLDLTGFVQGNGAGAYSVANLQTGTGPGCFGGWSLVVVYRDASQPVRQPIIPFGRLGYDLPAQAPAKLAFVLYNGQRGWSGNHVVVNGQTLSDAANPAGDIANSSDSNLGTWITDGNPGWINRFGLDTDIMATTVDPNQPVNALFTTTSIEPYLLGPAAIVINR